jgi:hypothetical protein
MDDEMVIALAAVTDKVYNKKWGTGNDDLPFRRRGIMTFLYHLAKLCHLSFFQQNIDISTDLGDRLPLSVFALLKPKDPARNYFFKKMGFTFHFYSVKLMQRWRRNQESKPTLPYDGSEIVYVLQHGKHDVRIDKSSSPCTQPHSNPSNS